MLNRFIKILSFVLLLIVSNDALSADFIGINPAPRIKKQTRTHSRLLNMYISPNGPIEECEGTRVTLVVNGANPNASFQWTKNATDINNSNNDSLLVLVSGTYNCIVTSPGNSTPDTLNDVHVTINPKPIASFTYTSTGSCNNTTVSFTNTSTISSGTISYRRWDFGDGSNTSNQNNPTHTFNISSGNGSATFNVKLIVTSDNGCRDTVITPITIARPPDPTLSGTGLATINGHPTFKICTTTASDFTFINASATTATNTSYTISWGDATADFTSSTFSSPIIHSYAVGTYTLLFTVSNGTCSQSQEYDVFVGNNPAGGLVSPGGTTICSGNSQAFLISGAANNPLGTVYTLTFNDGSTSQNYQHPAPDTVFHTFNSSSCGNTSSTGATNFPNSFGAYLTISNPCGTTGGSVLPIYVSAKPNPRINSTPRDTICKGQTITFTNAGSTGFNVENGICTWGKYIWKITPNTPGTRYTVIGGTRFLGNDNGSINPSLWISGDSVLNIRFDSVGTYTVKLIMANSTLCGSDSVSKTICVNPTPVANFDVSTTVGCAPLAVSTVNNSSVANCGQNIYAWSVVYTATSGCSPAVSNYTYSSGNSSSETPAFLFTNPGSYEIRLYVIAPATACSSLVATKTILVKGKPVNTLSGSSAICIDQTFSPSISSTCYIDGSTTYSWSFPNGTPSSSSSQSPGAISFSASGSQAYSVSVTNVCGTTTTSSSVNVNPLPVANAGPDKTTCSGVGVSIGSSSVAGNTYAWLPTTSLSSSTAANPTVTISTPGTYTYILTVTTTATSCIKKDTVVVTVNALPSVTVSPTAVSICAGGSTTLTASGADTYSWSPSTGLSATNVAVVTASPTTTTTYVVTGTTTATGCTKTASSVVTVNPLPAVSAGSNITLCDQPIGTQLTGASPAGGTWSGSNVTSGGLFTPNGVGVFTLTYTFTNATTGCINSATRTVTVVTATQADAGVDRAVCLNSGNITLSGLPAGGTWSGTGVTSAGVFSPTTVGTFTLTYTYGAGTCATTDQLIVTVVALPAVSVSPTTVSICAGGSTTLTASGADTYSWSPSTGLSATNVAVVTASPTTTTTYVVTGTTTATGCTKTASVTVTVNPIPVIANKIATTCSGLAFTTTPVNGGAEVVPVGTTYTWTVVDNPNVTGESDQTTGQSNISQTLTNLTNTAQTVVYTVTPKAGVCPGATFTVTVTVSPTPVIGAQTPAICSGQTFTISPSDNAPTTIVPLGTTYTWTVAANSNVSGQSNQATGQSTISQTLTNLTNTVQTVVYTVTPKSGSCTGATFTVTVTVNPKPVIGVQSPAICSGQAFTVSPVNAQPTTIVPALTTYTWTISNNTNISGQSDQATGQSSISQTLTNLTNTTQSIVYTVTPVSGAAGSCPGSTFTITVTVNPKPAIQNEATAICSGQAFTVTPSTLTAGNIIPAGTTYTWSAPFISPVGAITGGSAQAVGQSSISQTLTNTTANLAVATYTVTPTSGASGTCAGPVFTVTITVKPTPQLSSLLSPSAVCNNTPFNYTATSATSGTTYSWVRSAVAGISNSAASGNTAVINETLINTTVNPITVPYVFTLTANSCPNIQTVNAVINPDAKAQFTIDTTIGCAPYILRNHLTLVPNVNANSQADFRWYANGTLIGTGATVPNYSITNPGATVVIKLFAKSKFGCKDDSTTVTIRTVEQPAPSFTTSIDTACGPVSVLITNTTTPISVITGTSYSWNFGNGQTSTQVQPGNIVFQPNPSHRDTTYKITLNVTTACQTLTYIDSVTIRPRPLALFQIDTTVYCSPAIIRFRNNSLGMPNTYVWVWGDGTRDTVRDNRTMYHEYRTGIPMSIPVKLYAQNECGIDSFTVTFLVNPASITPNLIVPGPITYGCAPHPVTFVNNSVGGNLYTINFGDNTTPYITPRSNDTVSHLYASPGVFTVSMRSQNSCTDTTVSQQITVYQSPVASFSTDRTTYCRRAPVITNNQSTPGMQYAWDFGDGTPVVVNVTNPVHTYQSAGRFTIQLITTASFATGSSCKDTATQQVVVNPVPTATFTSNLGTYNCAPFNFVGNADALNYSIVDWHFATASGTQLGSATGFTGSYLFTQPGNYTVTMIGFNSFGCSDTLQTPFTVSASPQVSFSVADTVYCGSSATATFINTTTYNGVGLLSYEWYVDGVLVSTSPTQLTYTFNTTPGINAPVNFTVKLIATASQTSCAPAYERVITVLPVPQVNQPTNLVVCNGQSTSSIFSTINIGGVSTYTWTNDRISIGLPASGTGNISAFNAINTGTSPVIANITVTPHYTFGGKTCDGPSKTFTITVNPSAQVNQPANMTVCNGQLTGVNFTTNNTGGTTTYSWTNNNSSIGILSTNTGSIPAFYAINAGNAPVVATIVVTPTYTNGGVSCTGPSKTFTITVLPTAQVDQPANQVVCNGQQTSFTFGSSNTAGVTTFRWTNNNATIGLAASGTGSTTTFTAVNTTLSPVIATITVTPTYTYNGNSCDGPSKIFTITVNPSGQVNQPLNQVLCNGAQTSFIEFTTNLIGGSTTYTWTNNTSSIGLAAAGSGSIPAFTAINTGLAPVVATITVTPIFSDGGITCTGPTKSFTITVNPSGQVNQPSDQQICNGATTQAVIFSTTNTGGVVTYSWTNNTPSIGLAASGTGNIPAFVGVNLTAVPIVATITVTPTFTYGGVSCDGAPKSFRITVLPLPQPLIRVTPDSACAPMVVTFTNLTQYADTYQWFINGSLFSTAHTPAPMVLTQAGTTYVFELLASNSQGGCGPVRTSYTVHTLPTPRAGFNLNGSVADTIRACKSLQVSITNTSYLNSVGNTAGLNYQWYLNGVLQSFGGPNPSFFVQNISHTRDSIIQVKLIVSSSAGCIDSLKKYLLLFPEPLASFIINGGSNNCALPRNGLVKTVVNNSLVKIPGRYSWSVFNLTSASPSNGVIISNPTAFEPTFTFPDNLTNADTTYSIKLVVTSPDGCVKDTTINQIVFARPIVNFRITDSVSCTGQLSVSFLDLSVSPTSSITSRYWWFDDGGAFSTLPAVTHIYSTYGQYWPSLFVTNGRGCVSDTMKKRIIVFGAPQAEFTTQSSVCLGTPVNFINASQLGWGSTSFSSVLWDFGDGTTSNLQTPTHTYANAGTYTITLSVKSDSSCVLSTKTRTIVVMGKPKADFTFSSRCAGVPINFINLTTVGYAENGYSIVGWNFGDGGQSLQTNPWHTFAAAGTYSVQLIVSGNNCPQLRDTVTKSLIVAFPRRDSIYPRVFATKLKRFTLSALPGGVSYVWTPNIGLIHPDRQITDAYYLRNDPSKILYNIAIKDSSGCIINDKQEVWVFEKPDVYAPTAFTPNGDRANDLFIPFYINIKTLQSFRIFNRWGEKIFETNSMTAGWDGTIKGQNAPLETYTWVVECYDVDGIKLVRKGMVTLIRN